MDSLRSKVAYLQGLAQGLDVQSGSGEGKLLSGILDVLEKITDEFDALSGKHDDLEEYIEAIDDDLAVVEDEVLPPEDEESYAEVDCPACGDTLMFQDDPFEDEEVLEITCPSCGESIYQDGFEVDEESDGLEDLNSLHEDHTYPKE